MLLQTKEILVNGEVETERKIKSRRSSFLPDGQEFSWRSHLALIKLAGQNFRNYSFLDWEPAAGLNILVGDNAQERRICSRQFMSWPQSKSWRKPRY